MSRYVQRVVRPAPSFQHTIASTVPEADWGNMSYFMHFASKAERTTPKFRQARHQTSCSPLPRMSWMTKTISSKSLRPLPLSMRWMAIMPTLNASCGRGVQVVFLSDILPTAWHANELAEVGGGDAVAIWGAGPGTQPCYMTSFHQC